MSETAKVQGTTRMNERNTTLLQAVRRRVANGQAIVRELNDIDDRDLGADYDAYLQERTESLVAEILNAERGTRLLLETLGLPGFMAEFRAAMEAVDRSKAVDHYVDDPDLPYNPALDELSLWLDILAPTQRKTPSFVEERAVLKRILRHLPQIMTLVGKVPSREHDIQVAAHRYIELSFPGTIREAAVPQAGKTYKPDLGIDELETAIELKFADSVAEAKKAVDELFTDMKGFAGSKDYKTFYGVIYMTGPHLSQQILDAQLRKVGSPKAWETFIVVGTGARPPKTGSK